VVGEDRGHRCVKDIFGEGSCKGEDFVVFMCAFPHLVLSPCRMLSYKRDGESNKVLLGLFSKSLVLAGKLLLLCS